MRKQFFAVAFAVAVLSAGAAMAEAYHGFAPGGGYHHQFNGGWRGYDAGWLEKAPQAVRDAFKDIEVKSAEMRLEAAKGNTGKARLRTLHDGMLKSRRVISDYRFEAMMKEPTQPQRMPAQGPRGQGQDYRRGMHRMGARQGMGAMHGGMYQGIYAELLKENPDMTKVRAMYTDLSNLMEKQSKERFELGLKYPDGFGRMCGGIL